MRFQVPAADPPGLCAAPASGASPPGTDPAHRDAAASVDAEGEEKGEDPEDDFGLPDWTEVEAGPTGGSRWSREPEPDPLGAQPPLGLELEPASLPEFEAGTGEDEAGAEVAPEATWPDALQAGAPLDSSSSPDEDEPLELAAGFVEELPEALEGGGEAGHAEEPGLGFDGLFELRVGELAAEQVESGLTLPTGTGGGEPAEPGRPRDERIALDEEELRETLRPPGARSRWPATRCRRLLVACEAPVGALVAMAGQVVFSCGDQLGALDAEFEPDLVSVSAAPTHFQALTRTPAPIVALALAGADRLLLQDAVGQWHLWQRGDSSCQPAALSAGLDDGFGARLLRARSDAGEPSHAILAPSAELVTFGPWRQWPASALLAQGLAGVVDTDGTSVALWTPNRGLRASLDGRAVYAVPTELVPTAIHVCLVDGRPSAWLASGSSEPALELRRLDLVTRQLEPVIFAAPESTSEGRGLTTHKPQGGWPQTVVDDPTPRALLWDDARHRLWVGGEFGLLLLDRA